MVARFHRAIHRIAQLGFLLAFAAACGDENGIELVQRRDSAGIVIIETPGAQARAPIGWIVGPQPELQLGDAAGKEAEEFHRIDGRFGGGIRGLPDGRIVILNAGSTELLFFDREGRFLNRVNIQGNGPGQFVRPPILVPYASNDSLLIRDAQNRRWTVFSSDGQTHRSFLPGMPPHFIGGTVGAASDSGIIVMVTLGGTPMVEGQIMQPIDVHWINLTSRNRAAVAQFSTHAFSVNDLGGIPTSLRVPFTTRPSAAVGVHGFFVTGGERPEVRAFDNSGKLIRLLRLIEDPRRVKPEDVKGAIDSLVARFTTAQSKARWAYEQMDIPARWPAFQSVRVDRLGWIWVELFRPPHHLTPQWMVFDSSGVARGIVDFPAGLEVQDIGLDYVLGRWLDDLRVEYVRRYRLDRSH